MTESEARAKQLPVLVLLWLLALGLAGWTLSMLPLADIQSSIAALTLTDWLYWLVLNFLIVLLGNRRWQLLSTMLGARVQFSRLLLLRQAGQTISFLTPGPQFGGEPLQVYWLYSQSGVPLHKAVLALGLDRFCEIGINLSVLMLGVLLLLVQGSGAAQWQQIAAVLLLVPVLAALLGAVLLQQPRWLVNRLELLAIYWHQHPRLQQIRLRQIGSHWSALTSDLQLALRQSKRTLLLAVLLSLLGWGLLLGELALLLTFLDIDMTLQGFVLIVVALRLAMLLPLPGGIGTIEASVLWAFQMLELPASAALGLIALIRLRDAIVLVTGLWCLQRINGKRPD